MAAKEQAKVDKEQAKVDKLAAKEQSKADKLAAKAVVKKANDDTKPKVKRGRPKKDNVVVASGDYIENVAAQSIDLIENLAQEAFPQSAPIVSSCDVNNSVSHDGSSKFEDVQVHLFEFDGVMYYKSDDHVLYHHDTQEELGNWDPIENDVVLK